MVQGGIGRRVSPVFFFFFFVFFFFFNGAFVLKAV